jgi:hypothetical protein
MQVSLCIALQCKQEYLGLTIAVNIIMLSKCHTVTLLDDITMSIGMLTYGEL